MPSRQRLPTRLLSGALGRFKTIVVVAVRTLPPPSLQWTTWLALAWLAGAGVMLGRAGVKVAGAEQLRRASRPLQGEVVDALIREVKAAVNLTRRVRVAVTDRLTSPAVVGVLEPTLILPLVLITTLSPEQLRFILLHELAHIRRGDYLANLFQLFAEALFFFNPSVWWLSHQIRREREASCDALAIELSGAPADYASTLVWVAETMVNPVPAAAPAFGNDREPSLLADRVHRAMVPGYRPSLRLTWRAMLTALVLGGALLGLLAMGARDTVGAILSTNEAAQGTNLAKPLTQSSLQKAMAVETANVVEVLSDGSYRMGRQRLTLAEIRTRADALKRSASPGAKLLIEAEPDAPDDALVQLGRLRDELGLTPDVEQGMSLAKATGDFHTQVFSVNGPAFLETIRRQLGKPSGYPTTQLLARLWVSNGIQPRQWSFRMSEGRLVVRATTEELRVVERLIDSVPVPARSAASPSIQTTRSRQSIVGKLHAIRLPRVEFDGVSLDKVIRFLNETTRQNDPAGQGVEFTLAEAAKPAAGAKVDPATGLPLEQSGAGVINPLTGLPSTAGLAGGSSPGSAVVTVTPARNDISLQAALDAIVRGSSVPIKYSILEDGVCFSTAAAKGAPQLYVRTFKVDTNALAQALGRVGPEAKTNPSAALRQLFSKLGVDFQPPKTLFYNERQGLIIVRATLADLDVIEQAAQVLNQTAPQVNIRARFVEVPAEGDAVKVLARLPVGATNVGPGVKDSRTATNGFTGILTAPQARALVKALEQMPGVEILSLPDVTTVSGRPAEIQTTDIRTIVTGVTSVVYNGVATNTVQTSPMPFGPVIDVTPRVSADGFTVQMALTTTVTEFLGYDDPGPAIKEFAGDKKIAQIPLPHYRVRRATTSADVWDGQTIVLGGFVSETVTRNLDGTESRKSTPKSDKKQLLVFITPTMIDPAGNRIHEEEGKAQDWPKPPSKLPPHSK